MKLTTKRVLDKNCRKSVKKIYDSSFVREERMSFFLMCMMSLLPTTKFLAYYDGELLCAFTYYATLGRQIFLMFFAVDEALRGRGYGTRILSAMKEQNPKKKIIVSIEPCSDGDTDDINRRRKAFYQRSGFAESGYKIKLGKWQEVLVANGRFCRVRFRLFLALYSLLALWPRIRSIDKQKK